MTTTVTSTGITFNDSSAQSSAAQDWNSVVHFTASTTWTIPAGVTQFIAIIIGGGGGGGGNSGASDVSSVTDGGRGGYGGLNIIAYGVVSGVTTATITIGAGGTGSLTTTGGSGGTSSVNYGGSVASATGGGGGAPATNSNGAAGASGFATDANFGSSNISNIFAYVYSNTFQTGTLYLQGPGNDLITMLYGGFRSYEIARGSGTAAKQYTLASNYFPGAGGLGESSSNANDSAGGSEGTVFLILKSYN